jgi:hypothetical protein
VQFLRERERRTLLRERARAEKEDGADQDDNDKDYDDEDDDGDSDGGGDEYDDDDDDDDDEYDDDDVNASGDAQELRAMASAGALLRQALKSANRKESEFETGNLMCIIMFFVINHFDSVAALAKFPRKHLPNAIDVGPKQLSAMASAATGNLTEKSAAKINKVHAIRPCRANFEVVSGSAQRDSVDDSSWGDGSSTEEVYPFLACMFPHVSLLNRCLSGCHSRRWSAPR